MTKSIYVKPGADIRTTPATGYKKIDVPEDNLSIETRLNDLIAWLKTHGVVNSTSVLPSNYGV